MGPLITLGEIARIENLPEEELERAKSLSLGNAALPSRTRSFPRAILIEEIRRLLPGAKVEAPEEVRVHTAYRELGADAIRSFLERAIRHRMTWPPEAVKMQRWRLPEKLAIPVRATRTRVHFRPREDFLGRVPLTIEFTEPGAESAALQRSASVVLEVSMPVAVTTRQLRRGDVIEEAMVRMEPRDLNLVPRDAVASPERAIGQRLRRGISAGAVITSNQLETEKLVRRGDLLIVDAIAPGLEMRVEARALEAGAMGQLIRVENPTSRRRFRVEVTGPGSAQISLNAVGTSR
jgi:flagella basal body P-ring formation protein FlgA